MKYFVLHFSEVHGPGDWYPPDFLQISLALHQLQFLLSDQPGLEELLVSRENILHNFADPPDGQDVAQHHVSHHAVHKLQSLFLLLVEEDEAVELERHAVRPGQFGVLRPPAGHNHLHKES